MTYSENKLATSHDTEREHDEVSAAVTPASSRCGTIEPAVEDLPAGCSTLRGAKFEKLIALESAEAGARADETEVLRNELERILSLKHVSADMKRTDVADLVVNYLLWRGRICRDESTDTFDELVYLDSQRRIPQLISSDRFSSVLSEITGVNRSSEIFRFVLSACNTFGLGEYAEVYSFAKFWDTREDRFYISCGQWSMTRISKEATEVVDNGTDGVLFLQDSVLDRWEITDPKDPFEHCELFRGLDNCGSNGMLFKFWLFYAFKNASARPPLCITGEVGSGKTALAAGMYELLGMKSRITAAEKKDIKNFWVVLGGGGIACYDNVDSKHKWLHDEVSCATTGGSLMLRKLYTDNKTCSLPSKSSIVITSSDPHFASDLGLSDRLIVLRLERRQGITAETSLYREIRAGRDGFMSWICESLQMMLQQEHWKGGNLNHRYADFADMSMRLARAWGVEELGVQTLQAAETDKSLLCIQSDIIGETLLALLERKDIQMMSAGDIARGMNNLNLCFGGDGGYYPRTAKDWDELTAQKLGKWLSTHWKDLEKNCSATKDYNSNAKQWSYTLKSPHADFADAPEPEDSETVQL